MGCCVWVGLRCKAEGKVLLSFSFSFFGGVLFLMVRWILLCSARMNMQLVDGSTITETLALKDDFL